MLRARRVALCVSYGTLARVKAILTTTQLDLEMWFAFQWTISRNSAKLMRASMEPAAVGLPLLGEVHVAGLTEEETQELLTQKVRKFQREPRVHVFIQHYASRNVEVMGMVARPGTYSLNGPGESILSVMGRAGGTKGVGDERAAERVILFPHAMDPRVTKATPRTFPRSPLQAKR